MSILPSSSNEKPQEESSFLYDFLRWSGKGVMLFSKFAFQIAPLIIIISIVVLKILLATQSIMPSDYPSIAKVLNDIPTFGLGATLVAIFILKIGSSPLFGIDKSTGLEKFLVSFGFPLISWILLFIVGISAIRIRELKEDIETESAEG